MKVNVKATHLTLTSLVRERIEKICARLEKVAHISDPDALECDIEVEKTTAHHRHGNVLRAEINFFVAGKYFRAVARNETIAAALDAAYDEIKREVAHWKHKEQSKVRREGARIKDSVRQRAK